LLPTCLALLLLVTACTANPTGAEMTEKSLAALEPQLTTTIRGTLDAAAPEASIDEVTRQQRECQDEDGVGRGVDQRSQGWLLTLPTTQEGEAFLDAVAEHWRSAGFEVEESRLVDGTPAVFARTDDGMRLSAGLDQRSETDGTFADLGAVTPCVKPSREDIRDFDPAAPPPETAPE
jgi:hypothetical protein